MSTREGMQVVFLIAYDMTPNFGHALALASAKIHLQEAEIPLIELWVQCEPLPLGEPIDGISPQQQSDSLF